MKRVPHALRHQTACGSTAAVASSFSIFTVVSSYNSTKQVFRRNMENHGISPYWQEEKIKYTYIQLLKTLKFPRASLWISLQYLHGTVSSTKKQHFSSLLRILYPHEKH